MKRRLIKQGQGGYTITLPIKWIRRLNLDTKTELDVSETDEGLLISENRQRKKKEIFIRIDDQNKNRLRTVIASAYRRGFDKVTLKTTKKFSFIEVNQIVNSLVGFIITDQDNQKIVIKNMLEDDPENVPALLNKFFITTKFFQKEVVEHLTENNKKESELKELKKSIMKLRDYCQRSINIASYGGDKSYEYNTLIFLVEKIAGNFSDCLLSNNKKELVSSLNKYIELFENIHSNLNKKNLAGAITLTNKLTLMRKKQLNLNQPALLAVILDQLFSASSRVIGILI
jgi:phosphate uptake regulator